MTDGFIARHRRVWPTRTICRVLRVSVSGFYDRFERPPSRQQQANAKLLARIYDSFVASDQTYGSPHVMRDLQAAGAICSVNPVACLSKSQASKPATSDAACPANGFPLCIQWPTHLLERQFDAIGPNQKWAADFTYVWTAEG